jgi:hypothetical protein
LGKAASQQSKADQSQGMPHESSSRLILMKAISLQA